MDDELINSCGWLIKIQKKGRNVLLRDNFIADRFVLLLLLLHSRCDTIYDRRSDSTKKKKSRAVNVFGVRRYVGTAGAIGPELR